RRADPPLRHGPRRRRLGHDVPAHAVLPQTRARRHPPLPRTRSSPGHPARPHAQIIPYWLRRRKKGWLDPRVPREAYIRTATLLAFRQHQLEIARGARRDQYLQDIARFRQQLHDLLTRAGYTRL